VERHSFGPLGFVHRLGIFLAVLVFLYVSFDGGFQTERAPLGLIVGGAVYLLFAGIGWVFRI